MIAYLAAPIDTAERETFHRLKQSAMDALNGAGFAVYRPEMPFQGAAHDAQACYEINEIARRRCDVVLALYPIDTRSVGVPMEIQSAHQDQQPVAVVGPWSMQLEGMKVQVTEDVGIAVRYLQSEIESRRDPLVVLDIEGQLAPPQSSIEWVGEEEAEPAAGYGGDAGFDLYVSKDTRIPIGGFADVPHGICVAMPPGHWGLITGRSSTIRRRGLLVVNGIIDNGYRGPLFAAVQNLSDKVVTIEKGERLAQLIPFPLTSSGLRFEQVEELSESDRGDRAFGSTGA